MRSSKPSVGRVWQLQEAKNELSKVVDAAVRTGPQVISRRGVETAVVVAIGDYAKLVKPRRTLVEFFAASPFRGAALDVKRSKDPGRKVDL